MSNRVFELSAGPYGSREMMVVRFQGREEISHLSSFDVTVTVSGIEPDQLQADVLGAAARLTFHADAQRPRRVHGIVRRIRADGVDAETGLHGYTLRLVPRLWLLGRKKNTRIFQDRSVPEIVAEILREAGVEHTFRLGRPHEPRPYCVQYQETDLRFVERLLAEEGIFYLIEDPAPSSAEAASEVVVFSDLAECCLDIEGERAIPHRAEAGMASAPDSIERFTLKDGVRSGSVTVKHFDLRRPRVDLESSAEAPRTGRRIDESPLRVYDYMSELEAEADPRTAQLRLEQERTTRLLGQGESRCRRLAPGKRFALTHHPLDALNRAYVVLRVEHEGWQPEALRASAAAPVHEVYRSHFSCLPADVAPRPRRPKRRLQQVMETATVVGPGNEEIHTDELGRIKVQFHWDRAGRRDDRSSCWIRVMQPWAGSAWGFQFIPRVGMEVVVAFSGGDTDRPLVLGCAYNGAAPPPFPLPESKTQSGIRTRTSPGGQGSNELRFEDAAGHEQIFVHAQRDLEEVIEHDHRRTVRGQEAVTIDGGREITVAKDHVRTVLGNEIVQVEKNMLIHIVGRQIIQIDGRSVDEEPGVAASPSLEGAPPGNGAAAPEIGAAPEVAAPAIEPALGIAEAKLIWQVVQLPPDLRAEGEALEARTASAVAVISALRDKAAPIHRKGRKILERAATGEGRWIDIGATLALGEDAAALGDEIALAIASLTEHLIATRTVGDPRLAKARDAAADRIRGTITEVERIGEAIDATVRETRRAHALTEKADRRGAVAPRVGGSGRGGGGATKGFKDIAELKFPTKDLGEHGLRETKPTKNASTMEITGGGEINSQDGFRIRSQGCSLEMANGVIILMAEEIHLNGDVVVLGGREVRISGDSVSVKGGPITLN